MLYLVIPAYREEARLPGFLRRLVEQLPDLTPCKIRIVEDSGDCAARDRALKAVAPIIEGRPEFLPTLTHPENLGKGGAIKAGWDCAPRDATAYAFVDADGSLTGGEVARTARYFRDTGERNAIFASRIKLLGRTVDRDFHRYFIGRLYATLISLILEIAIYDSQCGLKVIPAESYSAIRDSLQVDGFAFDIELLAALTDSGFIVEEFPVDWAEVGGSSVNLFADPARMLRAALSVRDRRPLVCRP